MLRRDARQRGFTNDEVDRLADIFSIGMAAHDTVRELRGIPSSRVLLRDLRSRPRKTVSRGVARNCTPRVVQSAADCRSDRVTSPRCELNRGSGSGKVSGPGVACSTL